jgi:hypothetical protein
MRAEYQESGAARLIKIDEKIDEAAKFPDDGETQR